MRNALGQAVAMLLLPLWSTPGLAQTADEIVEQHLAASGGRAALSRLTSRAAKGSITIAMAVGEFAGTLEVFNKVPNKSRTLVTLDLSAFGGGQVISDQRFDGATGYVIDTFNGNREITGSQLEAMRNGGFPTPLLNYREREVTLALVGQEQVQGNAAYVIDATPRMGPRVRLFFDRATLMLVRTATTVNVPQLGGDIEQVVEFSDFRDVDGVKVPFFVKSTNSAQTITSTISDVKHNVEIADESFVRLAQ
jgi:hypothetical protein